MKNGSIFRFRQPAPGYQTGCCRLQKPGKINKRFKKPSGCWSKNLLGILKNIGQMSPTLWWLQDHIITSYFTGLIK